MFLNFSNKERQEKLRERRQRRELGLSELLSWRSTLQGFRAKRLGALEEAKKTIKSRKKSALMAEKIWRESADEISKMEIRQKQEEEELLEISKRTTALCRLNGLNDMDAKLARNRMMTYVTSSVVEKKIWCVLRGSVDAVSMPMDEGGGEAVLCINVGSVSIGGGDGGGGGGGDGGGGGGGGDGGGSSSALVENAAWRERVLSLSLPHIVKHGGIALSGLTKKTWRYHFPKKASDGEDKGSIPTTTKLNNRNYIGRDQEVSRSLAMASGALSRAEAARDAVEFELSRFDPARVQAITLDVPSILTNLGRRLPVSILTNLGAAGCHVETAAEDEDMGKKEPKKSSNKTTQKVLPFSYLNHRGLSSTTDVVGFEFPIIKSLLTVALSRESTYQTCPPTTLNRKQEKGFPGNRAAARILKELIENQMLCPRGRNTIVVRLRRAGGEQKEAWDLAVPHRLRGRLHSKEDVDLQRRKRMHELIACNLFSLITARCLRQYHSGCSPDDPAVHSSMSLSDRLNPVRCFNSNDSDCLIAIAKQIQREWMMGKKFKRSALLKSGKDLVEDVQAFQVDWFLVRDSEMMQSGAGFVFSDATSCKIQSMVDRVGLKI